MQMKISKTQLLEFLVILILSIVPTARAQWTSNFEYGNKIISLFIYGNRILVGTADQGVTYSSTDNGSSWSFFNALPATAFVAKDSNLFEGTSTIGVVLVNNYFGWTGASSGMTNLAVNALAEKDSMLFAGTNDSLFLSTNNGTNWTAVNMGVSNLHINAISIINKNIFVGTNNGIFLSTNNGTSWITASNGLPTLKVLSFASIDTNIFAGIYGGAFLSTNNGNSWIAVNNGLGGSTVGAFAVSGKNIFAVSGRVYLSTNNGGSWTDEELGGANSIAISGNYVFAGTASSSVWKRPLSEMVTTGIEKSKNQTPVQSTLQQNYPNPFNPSTIITFNLPSKSFVSLKVFDLVGREVATLMNQEKLAGTYHVTFDASKLLCGIYFYRLQTGSFIETKKLVLLK
jgi:Secretion system C-terminal sorting domain